MRPSTNTKQAWTPATKKVSKGRYIAYFKAVPGHEHRYGIIDWPGVWMRKKEWPSGCIVTHLMLLPEPPK